MPYGPFEFYWGLLIALYPFITGLVAGSFIVSTLAHVFKKEVFRPVAKLALIMSVVLLVVSALPLVADLGNPGRAYQIFTRPHLASPMAVFGIILASYLVLGFGEGYFMFREANIKTASQRVGLKKRWFSLLALGSSNLSESSLRRDGKVVAVLGGIGIPLAAAFHAYVGFVFGSVQARALWATPLMPVIFLMSALVSGVALLIIVNLSMERFFSSFKKVNKELTYGMAGLLGWFLVLDFGFETLEILTRSYAGAEEWFSMSFLLFGPVAWAFIGVQIIIGLIVPLFILTFARRSIAGITIASILALVGVLTMRINVVIGGQLIPRTTQAFIPLSATHHQFLLDIPAVAGISALAFLLFGLAVWVLPWESVSHAVRASR